MIADPRALARVLLDTAAQLEADEMHIKQAILAAARVGDCARIVEIVTRWLDVPAAEVLAPSGESSRPPRRRP